MESASKQSYYKTYIDEMITIESIISIHYFEFVSNYVFSGERHDFWELLFVDKGKVKVRADDEWHMLEQGDVIFHKPNEFHSIWGDGMIASNIVVVSFDCKSYSMDFFKNKALKVSAPMQNLLGEIVKEGKNTYSNDLGMGYTRLIKKDHVVPGCEQLIKIYLETFLIKLVMEGSSVKRIQSHSSISKERMEEDIISRVREYLGENINKDLNFDDICFKFFIGKTRLKTMFKKSTGYGVMEYFRMLKIEKAKELIRENSYNITEIASILAYDSVHYFSRCFKKCTNMSPSEYANSVMARAEYLGSVRYIYNAPKNAKN